MSTIMICSGERCSRRTECARYVMHNEAIKKKCQDKFEDIKPTVCKRHQHNNYVSLDVYDYLIEQVKDMKC